MSSSAPPELFTSDIPQSQFPVYQLIILDLHFTEFHAKIIEVFVKKIIRRKA
jgi:hypothetical protein